MEPARIAPLGKIWVQQRTHSHSLVLGCLWLSMSYTHTLDPLTSGETASSVRLPRPCSIVLALQEQDHSWNPSTFNLLSASALQLFLVCILRRPAGSSLLGPHSPDWDPPHHIFCCPAACTLHMLIPSTATGPCPSRTPGCCLLCNQTWGTVARLERGIAPFSDIPNSDSTQPRKV